MTKKNSWLSFMAVFLFLLNSCVHDEIYSASASEEYHSKSIFKEDEKYIKNVMKIYSEHEQEIKNQNGIPLWDYAMTMGNFDESFLIVPVVAGNTVVSCMQVPRKGEFISFRSDNDLQHIRFFQAYITTKQKKAVKQELLASAAKGLKECSFTAVSMWYPDSEQFPDGPGHWETSYITTCPNADDGMSDGVCSGYYDANGNCVPGYPYPGGGGGNNPQQPQNPCEKLKAQTTNVNYKAKIEALDKSSILSLKKETGYAESKSGVFTELPQAASTANSDGMTVTVTPSLKGYIHTHLNDYLTGKENENGEPEIKKPIRMFSPADVNTLMEMAELATDGNYSELYGTMVSSYGNYTIMFTGTAADIKTGFDTEQWRTEYVKYKKDHDLWTFEKLFLNFLKDKMNLQGVELYKIKNNGTVQKKTLNSNNNVQSSDCPQ